MITRKQNTDFGMVLTLVLLICGIWLRYDALFIVSIGTLAVSILFPVLYTPFSFLWYGLASILERVFSTLLLVVLFCLLVTPVALLRRWFSKDSMRIRSFKKGTGSVFLEKETTYQSTDLENQF